MQQLIIVGDKFLNKKPPQDRDTRMSTIKIHNKEFRKSITNKEIEEKVASVAARISHDYKGKCPILLAVLNGSFMFVADLMKKLDLECEISFIKLSSYSGVSSTGKVNEVIGLNESLEGRDVIIVEDIVDTGLTMQKLLETLKDKNPASLDIASLFIKPQKLKVPIDIKYSAFTIGDRFIVGYGLDYDGLGRNLPDIYDAVE